jgi:enoyl-[acyl-carrier-protein] reductase (NADH)
MAKALAAHNIFVYAVAPGFVETDMATSLLAGPRGDEIRNQSPLGRVARPEEVARTVLFLAAEGSEFLTGAIVDVNGASYLRCVLEPRGCGTHVRDRRKAFNSSKLRIARRLRSL